MLARALTLTTDLLARARLRQRVLAVITALVVAGYPFAFALL